jgi:hypothetical protein
VVFYRFGADFSLVYHSCKVFLGSSQHNIDFPAFARGFDASFGEAGRAAAHLSGRLNLIGAK